MCDKKILDQIRYKSVIQEVNFDGCIINKTQDFFNKRFNKCSFNNAKFTEVKEGIRESDTVVTEGQGSLANNATIEIVLTRPNTVKLDLNLTNPSVNEGKYTFNTIDLPKPGRWDIMAKVSIGEKQRYYSLKADTRYPNTTEF